MNNPCLRCENCESWNGKTYPGLHCKPECKKRKAYEEYRLSQRKFVRGERVTSLEEFLKHDWFMWYDRTCHREFFLSWQARNLFRLIESGNLFKAEKKSGS